MCPTYIDPPYLYLFIHFDFELTSIFEFNYVYALMFLYITFKTEILYNIFHSYSKLIRYMV